MRVRLTPTWQSNHPVTGLEDVKSYDWKSLWTVEIVYNSNKIERFYSINKIEELSDSSKPTNNNIQ